MGECASCGRPLQAGRRCIFCGAGGSEGDGDLPLPDFEDAPAPEASPAPAGSAAPSTTGGRVVPKVIEAPAHDPRAKLKNRAIWAGGGFAVLFVLLMSCWLMAPPQMGVDAEVAARFEPQLEAYTAEYPDGAGGGYVAGDLLPVETYEEDPLEEQVAPLARVLAGTPAPQRWRVSPLYGLLSDTADEPGEVGTVAQIDCHADPVGDYARDGDTAGDYGRALRWTCDVAIVDWGLQRTVARRSFVGGEPPEQIGSARDAYGTHPREDVVEWIEGLPRQ